MPRGQHAENLTWIQDQAQDLLPQSPGMRRLFERALAGDGELLRVSPHRTVLRLDAQDAESAPHGWLLKIAHPRRRGEAWRRRFSASPTAREAEGWKLLAPRLGISVRAEHEQLRPQLGVFARTFFVGTPASASAATAAGLAHLHQNRWVDRDLALHDLLWVECEAGPKLLPLDLGHATVASLPLPPEKVYLALVRLLSTLPADAAAAWAVELLTAHEEVLPSWQSDDLLRRSTRTRARRNWQRSRRALRTCSDFVADAQGVRRRGFLEASPPWPLPAQLTPLSHGPRSTTLQGTDVAWKFYPRSGAWQSLRRSLGAGPGRSAYRALAWLEILDFPASRPLAWLPHSDGEWVASSWIDGPAPTLQQLPDLAALLARLHRAGIGLRDAKLSNFRFAGDGTLTLVDADGLTRGADDPARDLARVIAECPFDDALARSSRERYLQNSPVQADASFERRFQERLSVFRAKLAAQQNPAR